jgi:tetratricopeptide (TPR) repeat protein
VNSDRIKALTRYYEEDPSDPFNIYALAMEYVSINLDTAQQYFDQLLEDHPKYLPAYYQAARCFDLRHQKEMAINVLEKGILLAQKLKEQKTQNELTNYLNELTFD